MKIKGNTVGTPMPRSDLNQTNPSKADYVKGREMVTDHIAAKGNVHGLTAEQVGAEPAGTAQAFVGSHNTNTAAHNDIRILIADLVNRLNAIANSDDDTLDQMAEIVDYIKDNRELIETITTSKVNVSDIIDNLYTNVPNKPLSAAQGVALKSLIDTLAMFVEQETAGYPIVIDGAADMPLSGMVIYGKTTQAGTPTPAAPVDLVNAGADGSVVVSVCKKNLLQNNAAPRTVNGLTFTVNDDKSVAVKGTSTSNTWFGVGRFKMIANTKYMLSGCPTGGSYSTYYLQVKAGSSYFSVAPNGNPFSLANDIEATAEIVVLSGQTVDVIFYPMVRLASITDDTYEPYKEPHTASIPTPNGLPGIPVSSGGNYTDSNGQQWICDEMDFERGVYVKRVSTENLYRPNITLVGNTSYSDDILRFDIYETFNIKPKTEILCNRLPYQYAHGGDSASNAARATECISSHSVSSTVSVFISKTRLASPDESGFKSYLQSNDTYICYVLATPVETPLDAETIAAYKTLHTYSPSTTILNDGGVWMHVKYSGYNNSFINSVAELVSEHNVSPAAHDDIRQGLACERTTVGAVVLNKVNDVVYISVPSGYAVVGQITIPAGYRPSASIRIPCYYITEAYAITLGHLVLGVDGSVTVQNANSQAQTTGWFNVATCYHLKQN